MPPMLYFWHGQVAELVDCTRLEIEHTRNGIEGSNPSLSARYRLFFTSDGTNINKLLIAKYLEQH